MKCTLLAVLAFVAVVSGSISPLSISLVQPGLGLVSPWGHGIVNPLGVGLVQAAPAVATVHAAPAVATVHAAPAVATVQTVQTVHAAPAVHALPAIHAVPAVHAVAPIQPGYVAATRGSVHVAPLPGNTPYASHHLNTAPAPGTK